MGYGKEARARRRRAVKRLGKGTPKRLKAYKAARVHDLAALAMEAGKGDQPQPKMPR